MGAAGWAAVATAAVGTVAAATAAVVLATSTSSESKRECQCADLDVLGIELRNATKLQEAFQSKIPELRQLGPEAARIRLSQLAGEFAKSVPPPPGYKGPKAVDYASWGDSLDPDAVAKYPNDKLCAFTDSARKTLEAAKAASRCDGIGKALEAHEQYHLTTCMRGGYRAYVGMHGADRAQEEAAAYGAQIAALKAEIARALKKNCPFKAGGKSLQITWSGTICSLEKPFDITGVAPQVTFPMKFVPTSAVNGTVTFHTSVPGASIEGGGTYTVEGIGTEKQQIAVKGVNTGHSSAGSAAARDVLYIDLIPLQGNECK